MTSFDWTQGVAIYAAFVSTGLLILRILEYWREGGVARVSTTFHPETSDRPATVAIRVTNHGTGTFTVQRLDLDGPGPVAVPLRHDDLITGGPELPCRIEPRSSEVWQIDARRLKTLLRSNGWNYAVRGIATLGTGKRVWESIHRYTAVH
jgi:hypothetical protein